MAIIEEFRETNNSLLSTKRNERMQSLTIMANVLFPVTMVAAIFSMNATNDMPFVGKPNDFWIVLGFMILAVATIAAVFKYKRWL
jgi:Mg2+ and Co2+ transporter CorA